jgi:hypothetical protein
LDPRVRVLPEDHVTYLFGGDDPLSNSEFATSFDKNCAPPGDLLVLNAFDDDVPAIAFVAVANKFVIGKTSTALVDLSERGHTRYQVNEHTALVDALLADRAPGQLSGGYDHGSFKRLKYKIENCITSDKGRVVAQVFLYKASLMPSASADADARAKSTSRIAIINWVELLFGERVAALEGAIRSNNFLQSCTLNMMQCGGDKSAFIPTNANGIKTSSINAPIASVRNRPASSPS